MAKSLSQKLHDAFPTAVPFSGTCFRNVSQSFAIQRSILSAVGSIVVGGRFNFIGLFEVLYLSCDIHTCLEETTRSLHIGGRDVAKSLPRTVVGIEVTLSRILDLTDPVVRRRLGLTRTILVEPGWRRIQDIDKREAFTQHLGRLARDTGYEAMLVPSAAAPTGKNLDIFPDRLLPSSSLIVVNLNQLPRFDFPFRRVLYSYQKCPDGGMADTRDLEMGRVWGNPPVAALEFGELFAADTAA